MRVTNHQAFFIARSLYKGINTGNNDVSFSVYGDGDATVGIKRKRNKYMIYVMQDRRIDKSVRLPYFTKNVDIQELADNIQQAIEESVFLQDKDLDTSKRWVKELEEQYPEDKEQESALEHEEDNFDDFEGGDSEQEFSTTETENDEEYEALEEITEESRFDELPDSDYDSGNPNEPDGETEIESSSVYSGFDILSYVCDPAYGGTIIDRAHTVAAAVADYSNAFEKALADKEKNDFVSLLSSLIEAMMFSEFTKDSTELRVDTLYMKDVFNFLVSHDLSDIEKYFKTLKPGHMAVTNYRVFSYLPETEKSAIMQSLIMKLSDYALDEFDEIFNDIREQMRAADEYNETIISSDDSFKENEEMEDKQFSVDNTNLEDENGEPNAFVALSEPANTELGEVRDMSQLAKQMNKRADEFSEAMKNVFMTIVKDNSKAAEDLYIVAMAIALRGKDGDVDDLAEEIKADPRDIIMADYEYELRKQEIRNNL